MFLAPEGSLILILSGFAAAKIRDNPQKDVDLLDLPIVTLHRHIDPGMAKTRPVLNTRITLSCCAQGTASSQVP